jgi:hypothetical protein
MGSLRRLSLPLVVDNFFSVFPAEKNFSEKYQKSMTFWIED